MSEVDTGNRLPAEDAPAGAPEQVFFVVRHKVKAGLRADYENWLKRIMQVAARFSGHQGVQIVRPSRHEYAIIVRFGSQAEANHWYHSAERRASIAEVAPLLDHSERIDIVSGLDYWFTPPSGTAPPRWKQWLLTTSVIWPLSMLVSALLQPAFELWPPLGLWGLRHGLIAAAMVALATFVIMPRYTRLLAKWLYKR
jgi:antibiotic biosynthesis monooxygenase (ABM) superfamily enzyme